MYPKLDPLAVPSIFNSDNKEPNSTAKVAELFALDSANVSTISTAVILDHSYCSSKKSPPIESAAIPIGDCDVAEEPVGTPMDLDCAESDHHTNEHTFPEGICI